MRKTLSQQKTEDFLKLLLAFNKSHNLVSKQKKDNLQEDVEDCFHLISHIKHSPTKILDLGSGNGFPGIIVAIQKPKLKIDLAEKQSKKAHFLRSAISKLNIPNATVIQKNIANNSDERYDLVVARAVAATEKILQMTSKILLPQAKYLLMKGTTSKTKTETENIKLSYQIHAYTLSDKERCILEIFAP